MGTPKYAAKILHEDDRRYRELWIRIQGYVVYKKDLQIIIRWSKDKKLNRRFVTYG